MTYQPRTYRENMRQGRFNSFLVSYKQSDLWIGVNPIETSQELKQFALSELGKLWKNLEENISQYPIIQKSLSPIKMPDNISPEMETMIKAGNHAGIGPMSAVAGFTSEYIGTKIEEKFHPNEIIVENGGDIYINVVDKITLSVFAGDSPLSEKIGVKIPASETPLGICTSSGKIGPSLSSGNADAVMIACENAGLADAFATAFGNKVKTVNDIESVLAETEKFTEILSAIVICDDKIGIRGKFEIVAL
ncbi:MAG: UPF0280 family protein [Fidelibacterota bacterium]